MFSPPVSRMINSELTSRNGILDPNQVSLETWTRINPEFISTPRFFQTADGKLYFGSFNNKFQLVCKETILCAELLIKNYHKYTSHDFLTLKEVNPQLWKLVTSRLPNSTFLVNDTRKEYVKFYSQPESLIEEVRRRWPSLDKTRIVKRVFNYSNRLYEDVTEKLLNTGIYNAVELVSPGNSPELPEEEEDVELERERKQALDKMNREIEQRVMRLYPNAKTIRQTFKSLKSNPQIYILVDKNSLNVVKYTPRAGISANPQTRLVWKTELLPNPGNPSNSEMEFFETLADVSDFTRN